MRVVLASFDGGSKDVSDDPAIVAALRRLGVHADVRPWTDRDAGWDEAALIVVRTTWDYTQRHAQFVAWVRSQTSPVLNDPALLVWNSDKHYLDDVAAAGIPTVPTTFVRPGRPAPPLPGEVVVKPTVSAGGRDTGRFGPSTHEAAAALIAHIHRSGRTAMVQPFVPTVDEIGETAVVLVDGQVSHVLRKQAVLRPDEVAPVRADALGAAEAMYDPDLVRACAGQDDELALAERVLGYVRDRFGTTPLQLRVDMLRDATGAPQLLEVEGVEPHLYLTETTGGVERMAGAIVRRLPPG